MIRAMKIGFCLPAIAGLAALAMAATASADLPVTGVPVPELAAFDDAMQQFMQTNSIAAGVLAVMKDGVIVYQRGFGHDYYGDPLPEITPMRIGSISKRFVAEAIATLAADGVFGPMGTGARAFDVGQAGGGILSHVPWPSLQDSRIGDITVQHLLDHESGIVNVANSEIQIGLEMGVSCPPGIDNMIRYAFGKMLVHPPGEPIDEAPYVNFGFAVLARIITEVTGLPLDEYLRQNLVTPQMWVPATDFYAGQPFRAQQNPREPLYAGGGSSPNVFAPSCSGTTPCAYGSFDLVATVGAGGLVCSAAPLLTFHQEYVGPVTYISGGICGTSAQTRVLEDGVIMAVLYPDGQGLASDTADQIAAIIDGVTWPAFDVAGFWLDFGAPSSGTGGHNDPFHNMPTALAQTTHGTKLRIKPSTSNWTGAISERMRLDAPFGTVRIGQ